MSDLRVLRITPHLFRRGIWPVAYDPVGGLQTQVWRLTEELARAGISQTVLTSHAPGCPRHTLHHRSTRVESVGISLPRFAAGKLLGLTWFLSVVKRLLAGCSRYDLVHIHYNHWIWCRIATLLARRLNVPVVVSLSTELWVSSSLRWTLSGRRFNIARGIERLAINASDRVIALTAGDAAQWAMELNLEPGRMVVIPDAIDAERFRNQLDERTLSRFRGRYSIPHDRKIVAYIGRIRSEKGWEDLPPIATALGRSGAFTLICGDGPDRRMLENAMREIGAPGNWTITGFLTPDEVRMALAIADVLILPSRREAFGSVLLEAMATGVPAVAYGVGGINEVAGTPHAIRLVPPNDQPAFIRSILEILNNTQEYSRLIAAGYRRVEDFSLAGAARETNMLYQRLLGTGSYRKERIGAPAESRS